MHIQPHSQGKNVVIVLNVVLTVSRGKMPIGFPMGCFFLLFFLKYLSKYPSSTKSPLLWKFSDCVPALKHCSFCKTLHLKCLIVFWICFCLDNCSVVCTVTLCYVLHQTHSELCLFRYIEVYSRIFNIIKAYLHIMRVVYLGATWCTFRPLPQNVSPPKYFLYLFLKNPFWKNLFYIFLKRFFLYSGKWNILALRLKNVLCFKKWNCFKKLILGRNFFSLKNKKKLSKKKVLFWQMELSSPKFKKHFFYKKSFIYFRRELAQPGKQKLHIFF